MTQPAFARYIGIDYSGAETANSSLKGLRVYSVVGSGAEPTEVLPPPSPRKYWTRRGLAEWLVQVLAEDVLTLVGIDHSFSFPMRYFEVNRIEPDWSVFLEFFCRHWPTDKANTYVDFIRYPYIDDGSPLLGKARWRRITEERARAKSTFHFDVPGSVAKSTHAGLPWLHFIRQQLGARVHFWPFDGWEISQGRSAVVEVYPSLWSRSFPKQDRTSDQHDAYSVANWLAQTDRRGELVSYFRPSLTEPMASEAQVEGWILGVM